VYFEMNMVIRKRRECCIFDRGVLENSEKIGGR